VDVVVIETVMEDELVTEKDGELVIERVPVRLSVTVDVSDGVLLKTLRVGVCESDDDAVCENECESVDDEEDVTSREGLRVIDLDRVRENVSVCVAVLVKLICSVKDGVKENVIDGDCDSELVAVDDADGVADAVTSGDIERVAELELDEDTDVVDVVVKLSLDVGECDSLPDGVSVNVTVSDPVRLIVRRVGVLTNDNVSELLSVDVDVLLCVPDRDAVCSLVAELDAVDVIVGVSDTDTVWETVSE
jgi:hypothetical protein